MLYKNDGSLSVGACDKETRTIYINENLSIENMKKVLCHEITHAFMISYHMLLTIHEEELFADLLATYGEEIVKMSNALFIKIKNIRGDS